MTRVAGAVVASGPGGRFHGLLLRSVLALKRKSRRPPFFLIPATDLSAERRTARTLLSGPFAMAMGVTQLRMSPPSESSEIFPSACSGWSSISPPVAAGLAPCLIRPAGRSFRIGCIDAALRMFWTRTGSTARTTRCVTPPRDGLMRLPSSPKTGPTKPEGPTSLATPRCTDATRAGSAANDQRGRAAHQPFEARRDASRPARRPQRVGRCLND